MQEKEKGKIDAASFGAGYAFGYMVAVRDLSERIAAFMERELKCARRHYEDFQRDGRGSKDAD